MKQSKPHNEFPHWATSNQDTDIEHVPPNPTALNPLPTAQGHTPTGDLQPQKAYKPHPHSASSTHSPASSTPATSCPHDTAHHSKARAPHNATPAPAHRCNRADTTKQHAHNKL
ncbi:hypothetical protein ATANTOWER_016040 [Ataeniobius toweri]|uniref:Uncharacterized protein n=1 Tax=Ataeniobius toweri TaxID=208326 RepID=A0ABU7CK27_9TELE|nr:hypothetical protein [Ataeniobius toweri]